MKVVTMGVHSKVLQSRPINITRGLTRRTKVGEQGISERRVSSGSVPETILC